MGSKDMIIRAWKDPEYRTSLSAEERAALPESPAGQSVAELGEAELGVAVGGRPHCPLLSLNRNVCD